MDPTQLSECLESIDSARPCMETWSLRDLERGHRNMNHLAEVLGPERLCDLWPALDRWLPKCPDADMALNNLERFLARPDGTAQLPWLLDQRERPFEIFTQLLSSSQFFSDLLIAHPDYLPMIRVPLRKSPSRQEMRNELQKEVENAYEQSNVLRAFCRFRQKQMLRIGTNDFIRSRPFEEITRDISRVADTALEVALQTARRRVSRKFGLPFTHDGEPSRCVILAFGKLGGKELNYSSDIDLMFLYDDEGETRGDKISVIANSDFYARVASEVVKLLSSFTDHGQAYRVDLRLRPEGKRGPLARSLAGTMAYYDILGRTWERQALIKVRPVAGDKALGNQFLRDIEPFIYRKYLSVGEINEIKALKRRIEENTRRKGVDNREVKTGHGGIRDVEFTIQFLQLLNGGELPDVRTANTLKALVALAKVGCLTDREFRVLDDTYRFLRKVEHRLQVMYDLQTHRLPDSQDEIRKLALRMGYEKELENGTPPADAFLEDYREKTGLNRTILDHLLHQMFADEEGQATPESDLVLDPNPEPERIEAVLGKYPFRDVMSAYQNLVQLSQESVPFLSTRRCRHFLASIAPRLLRAVSETPDPDMALVNLEKVTASLGGKGVLWELFSVNEASLKLYVDLCAWSQFLSEILINNPGMIDELLDSLVLNQPRNREDLVEELRNLCHNANDPELILHSFKHKELLRIGVRDILHLETIRSTTSALSDLAEAILMQIAELQEPPMVQRFGVPTISEGERKSETCRYVLLGLGKLGGREMNYYSDLDLVLIYEGDGKTVFPPGASRFDSFDLTVNFHFFTELAQHIIKQASFHGPLGRLYEVDMRLRPTGKSGSLVLPLQAFQRYYAGGGAQLWERQALTRSRVVYGDDEFGQQVMQAVHHAVYSTDWQSSMANEIRSMRERMEASGSERDVKRGFGGMVDVEFLVQLFRLKYGRAHRELRNPNTWDALKACCETNLISDDEYEILRESYDFLRLVESRLRIVHNRSLSELPQRPEDLNKLARRLDFEETDGVAPGRQFLDEMERHTSRTRELFLTLVEREREN